MKLPRPKKMFGQNFLSDPLILSRIADEAHVVEGDRVLEVGPGRGALTRILLERGASVTAVEIDRQLVSHLASLFSGHPRLTLREGDILSLPIRDLSPRDGGRPWKLVANLPYNISSPFLFSLLEHHDRFSPVVVLLQKEVGERLTAVPGTGSYGALTVLMSSRFHVRRGFVVKPGAFHPRPQVDSLLVIMTPRRDLPDVGDRSCFTRVVKCAFNTRRKTLFNSLRGQLELPEPLLLELLGTVGIDPSRRGETLSLEEFALLSRSFSPYLEKR